MNKGFWLRRLAQGDLLSEKTKGPEKIRVPIGVSWKPTGVSIPPPGKQVGEVMGSVSGLLVMRVDRIKVIAKISMALREKKKIFGGKDYYIAKADDGSLLVMFSENTSVEEVRTVGEYRQISRPGRDNELSVLIESLLGKNNPTKPFEKKIIATARILARRPRDTRVFVRIEESVWVAEVHHVDVWGDYDVDIGNLTVLPKSLPVTKDLLLVIIRKLLPTGSIQ